ncbi:MAG: UxaA family hydrolase [Acidipropionibacterium acidipropionici]|nr:UxaA family hydrolase [Acidipropionibacterium acidipropionici]
MIDALVLDPADSVAVATHPVTAGDTLTLGGHPGEVMTVTAVSDVAPGHKIALADIAEGADVVKYGMPIGHTTADVRRGGVDPLPQPVHEPGPRPRLHLPAHGPPDAAGIGRGNLHGLPAGGRPGGDPQRPVHRAHCGMHQRAVRGDPARLH